MKVAVKHFALCYDLFGRRDQELELAEGACVRDALKLLEEEKPQLAELYDIIRISVNWEYGSPPPPLHDGDEIALIPPVSGG